MGICFCCPRFSVDVAELHLITWKARCRGTHEAETNPLGSRKLGVHGDHRTAALLSVPLSVPCSYQQGDKVWKLVRRSVMFVRDSRCWYAGTGGTINLYETRGRRGGERSESVPPWCDYKWTQPQLMPRSRHFKLPILRSICCMLYEIALLCTIQAPKFSESLPFFQTQNPTV